jgi:hypothetical protein
MPGVGASSSMPPVPWLMTTTAWRLFGFVRWNVGPLGSWASLVRGVSHPACWVGWPPPPTAVSGPEPKYTLYAGPWQTVVLGEDIMSWL